MKYALKGAARGFVVREPGDVLLSIAARAPAARREGDSGTTLFPFVVTRRGDMMMALRATWTVTGVGGDPAASGDFIATSGTVSFVPGQVTANIDVQVKGDTAAEADEAFQVALSSPTCGAVVGGAAVAIILNDDTVSGGPSLANLTGTFSLAENASAGTTAGALSGKSGGSTLSLVDDAGGRVALSGTNIVRGATALDYESATSHSFTVRETLAGATNTPHDTVLTLAVTNVAEVTLSALSGTFSLAEDAAAGAIAGVLSGKSAGSMLSLSDDAGGRVALSGTNVVRGATALDYESATSHSFTVVETHGDGSNSPRSTTLTLTVTDVSEGTVPTFSAQPTFQRNSVSGGDLTTLMVGQPTWINPGNAGPGVTSYAVSVLDETDAVIYSDTCTGPLQLPFLIWDMYETHTLRIVSVATNSTGDSSPTDPLCEADGIVVDALALPDAPTTVRNSASGVIPADIDIFLPDGAWEGMFLRLQQDTDTSFASPVQDVELELNADDIAAGKVALADFGTRSAPPFTPAAADDYLRVREEAVTPLGFPVTTGYSIIFSPTDHTGDPVDDNFDDNSKDPTKWASGTYQLENMAAAGSISETSGRLIFTHPGSGGGGGHLWRSLNAGPPSGKMALFQVKSLVGGPAEAFLAVAQSTSHGVRMVVGSGGGIVLQGDAGGSWDPIDSTAVTLADYTWFGLYFSPDKKVHVVGVLASNTGQSMPPVVGDLVDILTPSDFNGTFREAYLNLTTNPNCYVFIGGDSWSGSPATVEIEDFYSDIPGVL